MDMPEEARSLAAELGWSEPREAFHGLTGFLLFFRLLTALFGLGVLGGVGYLVWLAIQGPQPGSPQPDQVVIGLSVPVLFFVILLGLVFYYPPSRVYAFREGVVYLSGSKRVVSPWSEIDSVFQSLTAVTLAGLQTSRGGSMTVRMKDGATWTVDNTTLSDAVGLITLVQEVMTKRILQALESKFQADEMLSFGELRISRSAISYQRETLAWDEVQRVSLANGCFVVEKRGAWMAWCKVPVPRIPNVYAFLSFVGRAKAIE